MLKALNRNIKKKKVNELLETRKQKGLKQSYVNNKYNQIKAKKKGI